MQFNHVGRAPSIGRVTFCECHCRILLNNTIKLPLPLVLPDKSQVVGISILQTWVKLTDILLRNKLLLLQTLEHF